LNESFIHVGVTPPEPGTIGHTEAPGAGCFDDKEGDDSIDWVLYEDMLDFLAERFCYDHSRVFASGNSSGAWWANELGCIYAGHERYPIRGIAANVGGLPPEGPTGPHCVDAPLAGIWIREVNDGMAAFANDILAVERAMEVNDCDTSSYNQAGNQLPTIAEDVWEPFPIDNNPDGTCHRMLECPAEYPIIVCPLPGTGHGSHTEVANPGFAAFLDGLF
jgi:poly(3-hydroxybutyrate) depolymerase